MGLTHSAFCDTLKHFVWCCGDDPIPVQDTQLASSYLRSSESSTLVLNHGIEGLADVWIFTNITLLHPVRHFSHFSSLYGWPLPEEQRTGLVAEFQFVDALVHWPYLKENMSGRFLTGCGDVRHTLR